MSPSRFMFIAGEASGDLLAAELVLALKQSPALQAMPFPPEFFGAGGPKMAEAGVQLVADLARHSVIGLSDALKNYRQFRRFFVELFRVALEREPDVIVCVDFSGFNRRFAHAIKQRVRASQRTFLNWQPKIVQYVSPQVWASRPGRAQQLERDVDLLLSIFPFEKEWYARHAPRLPVEFVGHPMVDRFAMDDLQAARQPAADEAIDRRKSQILLLPGSRAAELRRHLPVLAGAARLIRETKPETRFLVVLPNEELQGLALRLSTSSSDLTIQTGGLAKVLTTTDLAITKSGTVSLECAYFGVPAVVFYKTSWPTYLVARMVVSVKHLAMPNLLAGEEVYPEFVQHAATADNIARAALELLHNPERRSAVKMKLARAVRSLGEPGASARAAKAVLSLLEHEQFPARAALAD